MYEVKKDFNAYYLLWIFVILAVFGFTIYFYSCGEKLPSNREGVDSVRNELESATEDSRRVQDRIQAAERTTSNIETSTERIGQFADEARSITEECQHIIDEIRRRAEEGKAEDET